MQRYDVACSGCLADEMGITFHQVTMRDTVKSVAPNLMLVRQVRRKSISRGVLWNRSMKRRIKNGIEGNVRQFLP